MTERVLNIVEGPSKFDLMCALFDRKKVTFTVGEPINDGTFERKAKNTEKVDFIINSVGVEDGSGQSWLIKGYCPLKSQKYEIKEFSGYYETRRRSGTITVSN